MTNKKSSLLRVQALFSLFFLLVSTLPVTLAGASPNAVDIETELPPEPTGLEAETESGSLDVSLDWDDVEGATHYWIRWRRAAPGEKLNEGVEVESSDAEIAVEDYGEWVVRVQACNDAGCGRPVTTRVEVDPPAVLVETESGSLDVSLDWDDVDGAGNYWVRWRVAAPGEELNEGVEVESSDAEITVADYGEWVVRVQACNDADCGPPFATRVELEPAPEPEPEPEPEPAPVPTPRSAPQQPESTPTPTPDPVSEPPARPTGLEAETEAGSLDVSLDWDDVDGAGNYWVRWRVAAPGEELNEGVEVESSDAEITVADYGEWVVRVQACNDADCGLPVTTRVEVEPAAEPTPTPTPTPPAPQLQVSITANPANPVVEEAVTLSAVIANAPSGLEPSYRWGLDLSGTWFSMGTGQTFSYLTAEAESQAFRVTVSYDSGASATSAPLTVTWAEPTPVETLPAFVLSVSPDSLEEDGGETEITVTAAWLGTTVRDEETTISVSLSGSAEDPADYSAVVADVVIPADAGSGSAALTITPVDDGEVEGDETIVVTGTLGNVAKDVTITLADPSATTPQPSTPAPPTFDGGAGPLTRSVAENSPAGTAVGTAVGATDPNGDALTYTLTGADASSFTVDDDGQIKVGQGTTLDHETETGYSVTVNVSDGKDAQGDADTAVDASVEVGITVTDVMEPPLAPLNPRVSGVSTTGFTVEWDPPDKAGRPAITEYELKSERPDSTVTTHKTPNGTTYSISLGSLDPGTTHDLTLKARNDEGDGAPVTFTAATLASPPTSASFTKYFKQGEDATFRGSDFPFTPGEAGDVLAHVKLTAIPTSEGEFKLKESGGALSAVAVGGLVAAGDLDRLVFSPVEDFDGSATASFKVVDQDGEESENAYTLTLSHATNLSPYFTDAGPLSREVPENSATGTAVGDPVTATDPDRGDTLTYTLSGSDAGSFTIDGNGQIEVGQGASLDYETRTSYTVAVNVSDGKDQSGGEDTAVDATVEVTISVTDVSDETGLSLFFPYTITGLLFERTGRVDGVGLPEAEGGEGELTYRLAGLPRGLSFDGDTRSIRGTLASAGRHTLTYTATDEAGVSASFSFTLIVRSDLRRARSTQENINSRRPDVENLRAGKKHYSEPSAPGLLVSWDTPDMSKDSSGDNLTLEDIEQYELRHSKPGGGLTYTIHMSKDTRSTVLSNLAAGHNYRVDVRVKYSGERYTEWRWVEATTNTPPRLAAGRLNPTYILEWGGADRVQTISDDFTDPNGDALTYSTSSTPAGIVTPTIQDGGDEENPTKELRIHLLNPITGAANVTYGAHDPFGGYAFQVISVGGYANLTRDVAENSAADADVGDPVTGTPYGTETLVYTLTGEASTSGAFEIDSSTGQISLAEGAALDHETKSSYTGKVKWTVNAEAAEVNLTINVTDVDEPPLAPVNPQVTNITDTGFTVTWEAPDNTGRPAITEYELKSEAPDSTVTTHKTSDGATYSISLRSLDPGTTYDLTLLGRNDEGDGDEAEFTATTLDYRPRSADFTKYFKDGENATFAQSDFPFSSDEDDDVLASVKFTSIPTSEGAFKLKQPDGTLNDVAANSLIAAGDLGKLVFVPVASFDGLATAQFKVIDHEGDESGSAYTLTLDEVANFPPSFGAGPLSREVPENSAGGTAVGAPVTATDPDTGDTLTYSLSGTDASSFTIDSGTGQISVATGTDLDYEATKNTYEVEVGASDGKDSDGNADTVVDANITVNIAVTNVNEGPPPSVSFSLSEVASTRMKVTVTPPDTTGTSPIKHYTVAYKAGSDFNILADPAEYDGSMTLDSGTTATLTGLTPSTTYYVKVVAVNTDEQTGPEPTAQTATTRTNTAPTSADFTKEVSRQTGATFSQNDFPFTDSDPGDVLSKVKIVTLPATHRDQQNRRSGELRLDGVAVTAGQEVSVDDLGKLKYVPQPDGFRVDLGSSFTFKVLDRDGAESPTYTASLEQIADIVLTLSPGTITESATPTAGGRVTVTGTLTGPARTASTLIPQVRVGIDYDARENSDYTVNTNAQALTIPAGQKSASVTFDFTGIADFLVEGDEEIEIYPTWVINDATTTPTDRVDPVYLILADNDRAEVAITGPPGEVEEGQNAVFTVKLTRGITKALSVAWTASSGTASTDDFVGSSGTVTFPAGSPDNATQTITIPVVDDLAPEATERFSVTLGAITGKAASQVSVELDKGTAVADIGESDAVTVSVSGDERVTEGDDATYTFTLDSAASTQAITVDYTTSDKTALAGTDYTAASGTVTIPAGQTSATVTVTTTDNTDDEANRYFEFRMSNPQGGGGPTPLLSTTQFVNTTIVDDDGDPSSVVLSVDKTSFGEADAAGAVNVTATLEGGTRTEDATVVITLGGSATNGSTGDYTATTVGNITITGGESSGTASFTVKPVNDETVEVDETILVQGASAGLDVTPATITITDDDTVTLGIAGPAGVVSEGSSVEFTVTLSHAVASQVVVAWSAGSTAEVPASADDYSPASGSVIFPAGSAAGTTRTITMVIADDGADEQQETFTVTLGSVTGDLASRVSVDSAKSSVDVSIATEKVVTVTLMGPRAFSHLRDRDFAVYQVFLSGPVNADVQVDVTTSDGTATGCDGSVGGCTGGQTGDYVKVSNTLTIGPSRDSEHNLDDGGVTWTNVFVYLVNNSKGDADENFTLSLSNLRGGGTTPVVLGNSSVTTTITSTPLTFSVSGPEFVDEGTNARFVVTRNADLHTSLGARVSYTTSDGTAEAGSDYTAVSGTLEMPITAPGSPATPDEYRVRYSDWEVLVPILADNVDESDETFSLTLSNPEIYKLGFTDITSALLGTATATTTINDRAMVVSVSGPETVTEGGNADFMVSLSRAPTANLMVNYQTYSALAPLALAMAGDDYTPQSGTLTFVPGETSKRVRVPVLADATKEVVEYFRLLISSPSGGGGLTPTLGTGAATMGIVDAAGPLYGATVTVTPADGVGEGDGAATSFTVKVDLDCCTTFDDPTTVTVSLGGTATGTDDYTATIANVTIPASAATGSATLSITPVEDTIVEGDETIVVNGSGTVDFDGSATGLLIAPDTIDLTDNDTATVGITGPAAEVDEGSNAEFEVLLSQAVAKETTVAWSAPLATDTATAADLGATSGTVTFAADSAAGATQTISIPITDDNIPEGAEKFTVSLGAVGGDLADLVTVDSKTSSATATISSAPPAETVNVSGPATVMERGLAIYTISLSPVGSVPLADLTVDYATSDGSDPYRGPAAVAGTDYTARSGTVTFTPSNAGPQTIAVPILEDMTPDSGELFTFSLSNLQGGGASAPSMGDDKVTTVILDANKDITLTASRYTIADHEGSVWVTLTATRSGTDGEVTITQDFPPGGTATTGALGIWRDYVVWSGWRITIPDGASSASTTQALGFTINDDDFEEGDETIILNGRATGGLTVAPAILTIKDNDQHDITLTADRYTIGEHEIAASVTLTATRSGTGGEVTITGAFPPGGTATPGALGNPQDYLVWSPWQITIPDGARSASTAQALTFSVTDDDEVEGDETIIVKGTAGGGLSVSPVVLTIGDNDTDDIELSVSPGSLGESDDATSVTVTATLQGGARSSATVVSIGALSGTASSSDYAATSLTSITIPANSTSGTGTFTVTPVSDPLEESDETIFVEGTTTVGLTVGRAVLTILDEYTNNIALSVSQSSIAEDAGATEVTVTATRETARDVETVVKLSLAGTAKIQDDYTAVLPVTITIPANQKSGTATLKVTPVHDALEESRETIRLYGTAICHTVSTTDITLTNVAATAPVISFSNAPASVAEGSGATYTVKLEGNRTTNVTVVFKTGADGDLATAGQDYTAVDSTITFLPSEDTKTVTVQTTSDTRYEVPETFTVTLSEANGGGGLTPVISDGTKTTTIIDNFTDLPEYPDSYTLSAAPTTLSEGDEATVITFTATLGGEKVFPAPVDVVVHVSDTGLKGTAALTEDYTLSGSHGQNLIITIPASASSATGTLTLDPVDDDQVEGDETVTFTSFGGGGIATSDNPTLTITDNDTAPASITLSASPSILREGSKAAGDAVTITATLDGNATLTKSTAVAVALADGTAIVGSDYSAASATVTIPEGESSGSKVLNVKVLDDTTAEQAESLNVTGTAQGFTVNPAEIIILDDDGTATGIMLHASPSTVREDAGATDLVVTAAFRAGTTLSADTVISLSLADGTATLASGDYAVSTGTVTIPAGQFYGTGTFEFTPNTDAIVEPDETVLLNGSSSDYTVTPAATITIKDSTRGELSIAGPTGNVSEGGDAVFAVTLSKQVDAEVQVAWSAPLGTDAAEGSDLSVTSGTVTFAANSAAGATQTITITATDDNLSETSEGFTVTLGTITSTVSSQLSLKSGAKSATATISESDPIIVSISGPDLVDEGDATSSYTVSLSPSGVTPTADLTVNYATRNGTATAGSDYTATSGTLTFTSAAAGSQTFTVSTTEDSIDEGTGETFTVSISSPSGGGGPSPSLGTSKSVSTTISDDDTASDITLSASPSTLGEDDSETTITVTAKLNGGTLPSDTVVTINPLTGGATKGTDYSVTAALSSITISANSSTGVGTLKITPVDDSVVEGDETITIPGSTTVTGLLVSSASVTLTDDDKTTTEAPGDKDTAELSITGPASNVAEGSNAEFTVTLSKQVDAEVQVAWSAPLGTDAAEGSDLSVTSGTVTFAANSAAGATQTITITATDDNLSETSEGFTVTLGTITSTVSSQLSLKSGAKSATATISESDPIIVSISGPDLVDEGDATSSYTVSLSPSGVTPTADLTVNYATRNGTATAGSDYTATSGTLTFTSAAAGSQTFTVSTTEDSIDEGTGETFTVSISSPSGGGGPTPSLGTSKSVTTTITDDDRTPVGEPGDPSDPGELLKNAVLSITGPASEVAEGSDASFTVTLSRSLGVPVAVAWSAPLSTDTAIGADLSVTSGTVTFAADTSPGATQTITITATDDALSETSEDFTVTLGKITSTLAHLVFMDNNGSSATATISKSDPITIDFSGPTLVDEGDATTIYTVSLSPSGVKPSETLTVSYNTANGTATAGADYTATSGTVTFTEAAPGSQRFTVQTTEDTIDEGTGETFTVSISSPTGGGGDTPSLGTSSKTTTITDDDDAPDIALSASPSTLGEDDSATSVTVTATLEGSTRSVDTTVTIGTLSGTATKDTDYTATTLASITIAANSSTGTGTLTITPTDDQVVEGDETIIIPGTATGLTVSEATVTLTDDDKTTTTLPGDKDSAELSITGPASEVAEGGSASFTVTLSKSVAAPVTVTWSAPLGTDAAVGADLSDTSGEVMFAANSAAGATRTISIGAIDDEWSESSEGFTVTLGTITSTLSSQLSLKSGASSATATISESDPIIISLSGPTSVIEGDATTRYTVSLSPSTVTPTSDLVVNYQTADDTAVAGTHYTAVSGTLTFAGGARGSQTFRVQTTKDSIDGGTGETFTVSISGPTGGGGPTPSLGTSLVTTTITDRPASPPNDPPTPPRDDQPGGSPPGPGPGGDNDVDVGDGGGTGVGGWGPYPDYRATFDACVGPATETSPFGDVPIGQAYADDVDCMAYYVITKGTSAITYSPTMSVTREQMALFLTRMARRVGIAVNPTPPDASFTDIGGLTAESRLAINQIADLGITIGTTPTTYSPLDPVIRGHMALFIARLMNKMVPLTDGDPASDDAIFYGYTPAMVAENRLVKVIGEDGREVAPEIRSPYTDLVGLDTEERDAITHLYELGVTTGITPTTYGPLELMSRASMSEFMAAAVDHSNLRPVGLSIQADKTFDYGEYVATVHVSVRDEEFIPVPSRLVDTFQNNCVDTCGEEAHFLASGENAGQCNGYQTVGDCIWDTDDRPSDARGNIFISADIGATPQVAVDTSRTHTVYAWIGAEDGDVFDVDDDDYASVSASWTPARDSVSVTTSISSDAALGTDRTTHRAPGNSGPLVHLAATPSVVVTGQLVDSHGDPVRQDGVEVKVNWTRYVFRRGPEGPGANDAFNITYPNPGQATMTTDDDGRVTLTVNAPRDIREDTDQDIVDMVTFTVEADGETNRVANTMGSATFNWVEDTRVYQKATISATEFVLVDGDGDEDDDASIRVTARLLDQYGDGIAEDSDGNAYRITLTLGGNGSQHFTDIDPDTPGVQIGDLVKTPSISTSIDSRGLAEAVFEVNDIATTTHSLDIAYQVAQAQMVDGDPVDLDATADGIQPSYQQLTGPGASGTAAVVYVYVPAKASNGDETQVTVHRTFSGNGAEQIPVTHFATEGSGSNHGVLYVVKNNDTFIKNGGRPLPCVAFQPEVGDEIRIMVYSTDNVQASIRD